MSDDIVTITELLAAFIREDGNLTAAAKSMELTRNQARKAFRSYDLDTEAIRETLQEINAVDQLDELVDVVTALVANKGNTSSAAKALDMNRTTLREYLIRIGIDPDRFREVAGSLSETVKEKKNRQLAQELQQERLSHNQTKTQLQLLESIESYEADPPEWLTDIRGKREEVIHTAMLSDIHYAETVDPQEVMGKNEYNSAIAAERVHRFFSEIIEKGQTTFGGMDCERLVLPIIGDILTGIIHDELDNTNDQEVIDAIFAVADLIVAGIELVSPYYSDIFVPCVVGNHGRIDRKKRFKGAVTRNYDYAVYQAVARYFRNNDAVTVHVPKSLYTTWDVYSERHLAMHGDSMRGGSGTIGAVYPILRGKLRHMQQFQSMGMSFDRLLLGHWHTQYNGVDRVHCNGSVKGFDEYSLGCQYPYQPPMQCFFMSSPTGGVIGTADIYCDPNQQPGAFELSDIIDN